MGMRSSTSPNAFRRGRTGKQAPGVLHPKQTGAVPLASWNAVGSAYRGDDRNRTGMEAVAPPAAPTRPPGAALVAGRGEAPAAPAGSSPGHLPSHELQLKLPPAAEQSVQPWGVAAPGLCSEKKKTSSGMLSAASSVMQPGSLQLGSKVSWLLATSFTGAQLGTKGSLRRSIILCGLLVI